MGLRDLQLYLAELDRRGPESSSRRRKTHAIKTLLACLTQTGYLRKSVTAEIFRANHLPLQSKSIPDKLPGTVVAQWDKRGRRDCRCTRGELHGPYWYRFWREGGKGAQGIRAAG